MNRKFAETMQRRREERSAYFKECREEIREHNISAMREDSLMAMVIFTILIVITKYVFPDWEFSVEYLCFPILFVSGWIMGDWMERKNIAFETVQCACVLYCCIFQLGIILISVFPFPDQPASLIFVSFMVLSIPFVLPSYVINMLIGISELLFLVLTMEYKSVECMSYDLFTSLASCIISIVMTEMICSLTVTSNLAKKRYKVLSAKDGLTGLYNKRAFAIECKQFFEKHPGRKSALIMLDLDNFKMVNDNYGHETGDKVLKMIGKCIRESFRAEDIAGRFGGDEYMILLKNIDDKHIVDEKIRSFRKRLILQLEDEVEMQISCSVGALISAGKDLLYEEWLEMSDRLMYHVKHNGKNDHIILRQEEVSEWLKHKENCVEKEDTGNCFS